MKVQLFIDMRGWITALFLLLFINSSAQFILAGRHSLSDYFHDIIPDTSMQAIDNSPAKIFPIDLNHDGSIDFTLRTYSGGGLGGHFYGCYVVCSVNCQATFEFNDSCYYDRKYNMAANMNLDDTINMNVAWEDTFLYLSYHTFLSGVFNCTEYTFNSADTGYLGLRILGSIDTLYGWIKVSGISTTKFTVHEYACIGTYNIDTLTSAPKSKKIGFYPNPFGDELFLSADSMLNGEIFLFDIASSKVIHHPFIGSTTLDTQHIAEGVYLYKIIFSSGDTYTGKVIKLNSY